VITNPFTAVLSQKDGLFPAKTVIMILKLGLVEAKPSALQFQKEGAKHAELKPPYISCRPQWRPLHNL
jgi:hypothetical protein